MSGDSFTEVTHRSWVSRIGSAIIGILIGLVLFIISFMDGCSGYFYFSIPKLLYLSKT